MSNETTYNHLEEKLFRELFKPDDDPTWFMALWDAETYHECNRIKDWAALIHDGIPAMKDCDVQEWLDIMADNMEDEGDSFLDIVLTKMEQWGFSEKS